MQPPVTTPQKTRLLILDEDRIILQSLSQFLNREGYEGAVVGRIHCD